MITFLLIATVFASAEPSVQELYAGHGGGLVIREVETGASFSYQPAQTAIRLPPCSTFKIWNTAIGLENGKIRGADELFWKWDGEKRWMAEWNRDQTLRSAFAVSCVPAYQDLARRIGQRTMDEWIAKIGYGNRNTSSGLDVFWLPAPGRKSLLISPEEQAALMAGLARDGCGFSPRTREILKDVMLVKKTAKGTLYGKTGTGDTDDVRIGWFVGYLESGGKTWAFAAVVKGPGLFGKDARTVVERLFEEQGLL